MAQVRRVIGATQPYENLFPNPVTATRAPTTSDTNYPVGQVWVRTDTDQAWTLTSSASGSATWSLSSPGASDVDTLTGDSGGAISPVGGNITITGGTNITTVGTAGTITYNLDAAITLATSVTSALYTTAAASDLLITAATGQDVVIKMGDNAAANKVSFTDTDDAEVFAIDSNGGIGSLTALTVAGAFTQTAGVVSISEDNSANAVGIGNGTIARAIDIGSSAAAHTITIGSVTGAASLDLNAGTGNFTVTGAATTVMTMGTGLTSGTITIGATGNTGTMTISPSTAAQQVDIANADGAKTINIGAGVDGNTISVGNGINTSAQIVNVANGAAAANSTVNILSGAATAGTITLNLANGSRATAVNFASGVGGNTVAIMNGINTSAQTLNIASGANAADSTVNILGGVATAGTQTLNMATGASASAVNIGNATGATAVAITSGTGSIALVSTGTGDITLDSDDTLLLDADGVLELNSSAGAISIGNDADAQAINIGTGAAARTITMGNGTGATSLVLDCGTGALNVGTNGVARTTTIGNTTGASGLVLQAGTGEITMTGTVKEINAEFLFSSGTDLTVTQSPVMQSNATTGAAPSGATGDVNLMYLQDGCLMEQFILGAGQTIIAPRMTANGLNLALDQTSTEGAEYNFGARNNAKHAYTIGTSAAFFIEATIYVEDLSGCAPLMVGFRKVEANNATFANYTDYVGIGINQVTSATNVTILDELNSGGQTATDTTDAWGGDTSAQTVKVLVSASGVVTFEVGGSAASAAPAFTFDNTDVVMPYIHFLHGADLAGEVGLQNLKIGFQA